MNLQCGGILSDEIIFQKYLDNNKGLVYSDIIQANKQYYNIEASAASGFSNVPNMATLTHMVTADQLNTLNITINRNDQYNSVNDNCVVFAMEIWNSVASDSLRLAIPNNKLSTPKNLIDVMEEKSGCGDCFSMTQKSDRTIAYHTAGGYTYCPAGKEADG